MGRNESPRRRRRAARLSTAAAQEKADREANARRRQAFDAEEGVPDDVAQVLLKLGRRAFAQQAYFVSRLNDYRADFRKQMLLKAYGGSEERLHLVTERTENARAKAREYLGKAVAMGVEGFMGALDVQQGVVKACFDRLQKILMGEDPIQRFVERIAGTGDEGIQHATVRSIVLHELIKDLIRDRDDLVDKLNADQRRELFEFALGTRGEPPDVLAALFEDSPIRRPPGVPEIRHEQETRIRPVRFSWTVDDEDSFDPSDKQHPISLQSEIFEERELGIYVGHIVALRPADWPEGMQWRDARIAPSPTHDKVRPGIISVAVRVPEPDAKLSEDEPYRLPMLQEIELTISVRDDPWFKVHHSELVRFLDDHEVHAGFLASGVKYRCDISIPSIRCVVDVEMSVKPSGASIKDCS